MTSEDIQQLFKQTLLGEYEDEAPWEAVSKLRSNGSREIFEIAARWLQEDEPLKRARAAAILAQLKLPTEAPTTEPKGLFREEAFPLIADMRKQMVLDPAPEDRRLHARTPWLGQSLHPAVQLASRPSDLAFPLNPATHVLHAVADRLLRN
jgi:hypothetical protein